MLEQISQGLMPILTQAVISVLGILVTLTITKVAEYLEVQKEALTKKVGADQFKFYQSVAESIFYAVEQQLKQSSNDDKRKEFDKRLLEKIPGLTQDEIEHFRESVIGKIKDMKGKILEKPKETKGVQCVPAQPYTFPSNPLYPPSPIYCDAGTAAQNGTTEQVSPTVDVNAPYITTMSSSSGCSNCSCGSTVTTTNATDSTVVEAPKRNPDEPIYICNRQQEETWHPHLEIPETPVITHEDKRDENI
jgi:hypothetical protein